MLMTAHSHSTYPNHSLAVNRYVLSQKEHRERKNRMFVQSLSSDTNVFVGVQVLARVTRDNESAACNINEAIHVKAVKTGAKPSPIVNALPVNHHSCAHVHNSIMKMN